MHQQTVIENNAENKGIFYRALLLHREKVFTAQPNVSPSANVDMIDITVPISSQREIPVRIFRPKTKPNSNLYPTLFYIPGTAFIAYENKFTNLFCSNIAELSNAQVIILYHALAPEHKFPQGYKEVFLLFSYFIKTNSRSYQIDIKHIAVAGYSSGGNLAALLALQAKANHLPINKQILISPLVDLSRTINKLPEFHELRQYEEKDKAISPEFVAWFLDLYIPPNYDPKRPEISPYWQEEKQLKKLPPTTIIVAEYDRFRTDAEAYYEKLKAAAVPVDKIIVDKENHAYVWYNQSIAEKVKEQLDIAFNKNYIDRPIGNTISYVLPNPPSIENMRSAINVLEQSKSVTVAAEISQVSNNNPILAQTTLRCSDSTKPTRLMRLFRHIFPEKREMPAVQSSELTTKSTKFFKL